MDSGGVGVADGLTPSADGLTPSVEVEPDDAETEPDGVAPSPPPVSPPPENIAVANITASATIHRKHRHNSAMRDALLISTPLRKASR
jgi:hypothetical protein